MRIVCLLATLVMISQCSPVLAQGQDADFPSPEGLLQGEPETGQPLATGRGAGVFHGNYCGLGDNGPGLPAVDALDLACEHHDACTPSGGVATCACNARFARETQHAADSTSQPEDLRALAGIVEGGIAFIPCHP